MDIVLKVAKTVVRCSMKEKIKQPKYTKEFKEYTIKLVTEQRYNCTETGERLGINPSNISYWVCQSRQDQKDIAEGGVTRKELEVRIRRLEKENKRLWR